MIYCCFILPTAPAPSPGAEERGAARLKGADDHDARHEWLQRIQGKRQGLRQDEHAGRLQDGLLNR